MAGLSKRRLRATGTAAVVAAAIAPAGASAQFEPGASGVGDPFFPNAGNGGYDVSRYRLDLDYSIKTRQLDTWEQATP